ncbi:DUF721 domain-containing protein [bacterium SCSIO 12741]|nr:DUF721 domain-containing protein [bacterium SCSIO 12741]
MKALLKQLMKQYQLDDRLQEVDLRQHWEELMGKMISRHTRKLEIRGKTLYLQMDSAVLKQELSYGKDLIVQKVNGFAGSEVIEEVVIR